MIQAAASSQGQATDDLHERAAVYLFFARLLRGAPSAELLQEIVRRRLLTLAEPSSEAEDSLDTAEEPRWLPDAEALAVEYARLFAVPGERAVRPYESVYCDTVAIDTSTACSAYFAADPTPVRLSGCLHGPSAVTVREAYRRAGFELDPGVHELSDHLALELEFVGRLLERRDVDRANTFFAEHLSRWAFRCVEEISRKTSPGFYRIAADALAAFLRHEQQILVGYPGK